MAATQCTLAQGPKDQDGYVWVKGRSGEKAHRVAYEMAFGPIPAGMWVLHTCDQPACVNPAHLWLGGPSDNTQDMIRKGRARFGGRNTTMERVRIVRARVAAGETQRSVAKDLGLHFTTVNRMVRGRTWKGVM